MLAVYLSGNVSVSYGRKEVIGNQDSAYATELAPGMDLYVANNHSGTSELEFAGRVDMIINNSIAYLREASPITLSGPHPAVIVPGVSVTANKGLRITTSAIPAGYKPLVQHLIESVEYGMFKNTTNTQTFHSPIADPKTGLPVNLLATVYSKDTGASPGELLQNPINILGSGSSNSQGSVSTSNNSGSAVGPGSGSLQQNNMLPGYTTPSDLYGGAIGSNIPRTLYNDPGAPDNLSSNQKQTFDTSTDNSLRTPDPGQQFVVTSGSPISGTPGTSTLIPIYKMPEVIGFPTTVYNK